MNANATWITDLRRELERRRMSEHAIDDAIALVRDHSAASGADHAHDFGDPVVYAATLVAPADDDTPAPSLTLVLLLAVASFAAVLFTVVPWVSGDVTIAPWAIMAVIAFVVFTAASSVALARRAVGAALRDGLTRRTDGAWSVGVVVLTLIPWILVAFAVTVIVIAACMP